MLVLIMAAAVATHASPPAAAAAPFSPADRTAVIQTLEQLDEIRPATATGLSEPALRATLLRRAKVELGQRVRPSSIDRVWAIQPAARNVVAELEAAQREGRLTTWLEQLSPAQSE